MKKIIINTEKQFRDVFSTYSNNKASKGDVLLIKKILILTQDVVINVPVVIELDAGKMNTNGHLIIKKSIVINGM